MLAKFNELRNNSGFIKYFFNTSWVFGGRVLQIISSLFIGVWVTRYLGPENYGILSYSLSFVGIFMAFSTLGLNDILVRELVKTPKEKYTLLGTTFALQTLGSLILIVLLIIAMNLSDNDSYTNNIIIILGAATFFQSFTVIDLYFQSTVNSKIIVFTSIFALIISSLLKILLILTESSLMAFVIVTGFDSVVMAIGMIYFYNKNNQSLKAWNFSIHKAKLLIKDSWPLILSSIVVSIYMKIDQVMLKEMMDNNAVGQYAAAVRLSEAWYFIPTIICSSLFPALVNAKKISNKLFYERLQKLYDLMIYISVPIALLMTFLSDWIINLLYGSEFIISGQVLSIHIWAAIFVFLGVSRGGWVINENLQRYTALYLGAGMITNIILNFIMIPTLGILGAAYATLISQAISVLFAPLLFKETRISFFMMIKSLSFYALIKKN